MDVMDVLNFSSFSWLAFSSAHLCDVCFLWSWPRFASFVGSIRFYGILGQAFSAHCAHSLLYFLHSVQFLILYSVKLERITYGKWSTSRAHYSSEPSIFAKFIYYEINTMYFTLSEPSYGGRAVAAHIIRQLTYGLPLWCFTFTHKSLVSERVLFVCFAHFPLCRCTLSINGLTKAGVISSQAWQRVVIGCS